jgi:hypothetical protein
METVITTSSLIEPACTGREATVFLRKELVDKWDALEAAFRDPKSKCVRGGIAGTAGTGKTWSLNYVRCARRFDQVGRWWPSCGNGRVASS